MKLRYIYTLLTLLTLLSVAPAIAQTKPKEKKPVKKAAPAKKTDTKKLGDAAAKTSAAAPTANTDTTKDQNALSAQIVVTTAYKPLLADAVKIRRNPDLEDATPYKAPLTYNHWISGWSKTAISASWRL